MIPENKDGDYFYTLISSSESYQTIAGQIKMLPGVHTVTILSEAQIKEEVKTALGSLQVEINNSNLDLNYAGLKVVFVKDLKPRAQGLIREYLSHLAGEGNITLGAIKNNDQSGDKRAKFIQLIKTWGYLFYLFIVLIFWTVSLFSIRRKIVEASYLLENYQRKKKIGLKVALLGLGLFFVLSVFFTFLLGIPPFVNLAIPMGIFIFGISLHGKKYSWEAHS